MRIRRSVKRGLIFCLLFALFAGWLAEDYFRNIELRAYDLHMRNSEILASQDIILVVIDDHSIEKIGAWPWSRDLLGKVINDLGTANANIIATTEVMSEIQKDMGSYSLEVLQEKINILEPGPNRDLLQAELENSLKIIQTDKNLSDAITTASTVILPIELHPVASLNSNERPNQALKSKIAIANKSNIDFNQSDQFYNIKAPNEIIAKNVPVFGHINKTRDSDTVIRKEQILWPVENYLVPSLAFRIYLQQRKNKQSLEQRPSPFTPEALSSSTDKMLQLDDLVTDIPAKSNVYSRFYSDQRLKPFKRYSFYDVFTENVPFIEFENKIVLIGPTGTGIGSRYKVASGQTLSAIENLAHVSSSLINTDWIRRGQNQKIIESIVFLFIGIFIVFIAPRRQIVTNLIAGFSISFLLLIFQFGSLEFSYWYKFITPVLFLLFGLIALSFTSLRSKDKAEARRSLERDEINLQLGSAFQKQGALDLAFEKFLECKENKKLLTPLYGLGLEYERKRQFAKSMAVYEHMKNIDPDYLDIESRLTQSKNMAMNSTQQVFGTSSRLSSLLNSNSGVEKPRLGRYEIESEIGRGAMSIVYAGRDPSINRLVAIKVQSFIGDDEKQLAKMRERFLTEAKTAGHLNHPDIITIYDIGEEVDLIYIAMEYLSGKALDEYDQDNILADETIFDISIRMARALNYAHDHKVIHRDVKPSNIIFDEQTGNVHLTDFGIARMQDAHLTQTGQVVGTPSYMSPEQITGKRVDHRSDLFSLGATMYQLFTGKLPFQADTMATLLYKITMEAPIPFDAIRPDLPAELTRIISKLLKKEPDERYQTAEELANALEDCKNSLNNIT